MSDTIRRDRAAIAARRSAAERGIKSIRISPATTQATNVSKDDADMRATMSSRHPRDGTIRHFWSNEMGSSPPIVRFRGQRIDRFWAMWTIGAALEDKPLTY